MKLKKPKFWDYNKPSLLSNFLYPISKIIEILTIFKFKKKIKIENVKTICIGNIYLGGTGKTSLAIKLKELFDKHNINSCFIKKNYSDQIDEQKLLESKGKLFCEKNRIDATNSAIKENFNVAIFDDGLQDRKIKYDISIVCFNQTIGVGNGLVLPSGPLRENLKSLKKYDAVFLNGNSPTELSFEKKIQEEFSNIKVFKSTYSIINLEEFDNNERYLAFAGIGNFDNFIDLLKVNNINLVKTINYPDHYKYNDSDLKKIKEIAKFNEAKIITTEKDFLRINENDRNEINVVKIKLNINNNSEFTNFLKKNL